MYSSSFNHFDIVHNRARQGPRVERRARRLRLWDRKRTCGWSRRQRWAPREPSDGVDDDSGTGVCSGFVSVNVNGDETGDKGREL